ncbi:MAG: hypothetical protein U0414_16670 [Polyangiaceae bacterium]
MRRIHVGWLAVALVSCGRPPPLAVGTGHAPPPRCNGPQCDARCSSGDAAACTHRANELQDRLDTGLDPEITTLLLRACAGDDAQGCLELAVHCGRQQASVPCEEKAFTFLYRDERERCAESGAIECLAHARTAMFDDAFGKASRACSSGTAGACFLVGYTYEAGYGSHDKDLGAAVTWYREGCTMGDADSCDSLAVALRRESPTNAEEADRADARAVDLRERACDAADALACMSLSDVFAVGRGATTPSEGRARDLRARACALGLDDRRCR